MAKRQIDILIGAEYTGRSAFAAANSDLQAHLAQARESHQQLNPFGQLVAHAERQDAAAGATAGAAARAQADLSAELAAANAAARSEYLHQEQAAILASAREEQAQAVKGAAARRDVNDRLYAATHTARETDLRSLRRYYAQMRLEAQGNARQLTLIDQAYQAERGNMTAVQGGGGGLGGLFKRGGAMRQGLKFVGEQAAFSVAPELGLAGSMISGAGLGAAALPVGAAFAAIGFLVAGFKGCTDAVNDAQKAMKEFADFGQQTVESHLAVIAETRAPTGVEAEKAKLGERDKKIAEISGRDTDKTSAWNEFWTGGPAKDSTGAMLTKEAKAQQARDLASATKDREEYRAYVSRKQETVAAQKKAHEEETVGEAKIAGMYEGPAKAKAALELKQKKELGEARAQNYLTPGAVNEKPILEKQAVERANLERQQQDEIRRDRLAAEQANISATQDGYAREVALLALKHRTEIEEYDRAGRDKTNLVARQASERVALAKAEAREIQQLWNQYTAAWVSANLRGVEAERAGMKYRHEQQLLAETDPAKRTIIEQTQAQERAKLERDVADRNQDAAYQTVEARLRLMTDGNQKEMALLRLRQQQQAKADKEAGIDPAQTEARQAAERALLEKSQREAAAPDRKVSIAAVERGFLTRAPGQYDPWKEIRAGQKDANKAAAETVKLNAQAVTLLQGILTALGITTPVADLN
jgi:hypothetical protein